MDPTIWAVALLIAAMALCFLEIFIPSMGIITFFAVCCAAVSCVLAFSVGGGAGVLFIFLNLAAMGVGFALGFRFLPHSPLAMHSSQVETAQNLPGFNAEKLMGSSGVAFTDLRPGGTALIDDQKIDVIARGGYIDEGTRVTVVRIEGSKVQVAPEEV